MKNCPFILTDDLSGHYKQRCELYNINNNSRYSNQYICSYNPMNEFGYKSYYLKGFTIYVARKINKKIEDDYLVCVDFIKTIDYNQIVNSFCEEYIDENKYYCSRTDQPKKYDKVDDKNCKSIGIYALHIIINVFIVMEMLYLPMAANILN